MNDSSSEYEVWRSGPGSKARDVRLYFGLDKQEAKKTLNLCNQDKAEAYPNVPVEFYLVHVTRTRIEEGDQHG